MKKSYKLLSLLLVFMMVFSLMSGALAEGAVTTTAPAAKSTDIVVLYTNDVHGAETTKTLGYAGVAAYKKDMLKTNEYVSLVDSGDFAQGGNLNTLSRGAETIDIMNQAGYDVVTIGNHEFDWQIPQLLKLMGTLKAKVVSCNFVDLKTGKSVFDGYTMMTYGSTKVAYVGITTPEAYTKSTPGYFEDANGAAIYGLCEGATEKDGSKLYAKVQSAVNEARAAGAKYVIALGHLGIEGTTEGLKSTDVIANTTGIDVMLDGHSHEIIAAKSVANKDGKNVLLSSTGTGLEAIGKLVIKADGTMVTSLVTDFTEKDADTAALIKTITEKYSATTSKSVGESKVTLPTKINGTRVVRNSNSALGDFDSDAMRAIMGTDIAFANGGGLREQLTEGKLNYGDITKLHPFSNTVVAAEVTGKQILNALEMGARKYPEENGGFLHAAGLKYTIDSTIPSTVTTDAKGVFTGVGGAYRVTDVKVLDKSTNTYKALDLTKTYTLAMNSYNLVSRGDGFSMFKGAKIIKDTGILDRDLVTQYITENLKGVIPASYAAPQGRITVLCSACKTFSDVVSNSWYDGYVKYCVDNKLMSGTSATTFAPMKTMDRATFVTMLYALAGSPAVDVGTLKFTDVAPTAWYAKAVAWAVGKGITSGLTDTTFGPAVTMSRQQMAVFMYKNAGAPAVTGELTFSDKTEVSAWAVDAVNYCTANKLMSASGDVFNPTGNANRAMGAVVLTQLHKTAAAAATK